VSELLSEPLSFSLAAASRVWELIKEEGNFNLKLRVYVTGGGCSGMKYGFTFDEVAQADDAVVSRTLPSEVDSSTPTVQLLIDSLSLQYLSGAEIDYQEASVDAKGQIIDEQFIIRNPNAKTSCGCGSSFTPKEEEIEQEPADEEN